VQVTGQDEQQPRKERQARELPPAAGSAATAVIDAGEVDVAMGTASDAEEYSDIEEEYDFPLDLDSIVLVEPTNENVSELT